ncbi:MAG: hypothetical protein BGO98_32215 [Myxococcales bacterium 68-20]|nr:MAG: hypothetical protein BGO98_32215 [Myxococcales bacterium 68-20]
MKAARAIAALGALSVGAFFLACASDEDPTLADPNNESRVPGLDGGADADASQSEDEPCVPGALCPFGPFEPSTPGGALDLRTRIHLIRGRSPSDVWALGARGAVAHFDGTSWSRAETGATESFRAVWLRETSEIALASLDAIYSRNAGLDGPDGGVPSAGGWLRTNPAATAPEMAGRPENVSSVWASPSAEWLWGTSTLADWIEGIKENGLWRARIAPGTQTLEVAPALPRHACELMGCVQMLSIHGSSADDLWAVGVRGAAFHITGAQSETPTITAFDSQTWAGLDGVWAASATDVWAVGGAGTIRRYTGGAVSLDVVDGVPTTEDLHGVWGTSSSDVWAVGDAATVLHYDGATWSRVEIRGLGQRKPNLFTVWSPAPGHVWVGGEGVILSLGGKP